MLPAEMADGTRAQVQRRREEEEAAEEGDANPVPNPEVVLPNNQDGDNPFGIPDREEDETRDDYAVRVMQAVSQHQINSFNQMIQSMKDISKEVKKKKKPEWEETDEDEDSDNSNYQDAVERPKIRRIRKRIQAPIFKGMIGEHPEPHLLRAVDWFDSQGIKRDIDKVYNFKHTLDGEAREWYADYAKQTSSLHGIPSLMISPDIIPHKEEERKTFMRLGEICPSHQPPTMSRYSSEICKSAQNN